MASYAFLSTWLLEAPRQDVWDAIAEAEAWPEWWPGVTSSVEVRGGDERRIGSRHRVAWRSLVPYTIEFEFEVEAVREPSYMAGRATGDLEGTGVWRLYEGQGVTAVTYDWRVRTRRRWMNAVAPLARPVFEWSHDWVMARGGEGLSRRLGAPLLARG